MKTHNPFDNIDHEKVAELALGENEHAMSNEYILGKTEQFCHKLAEHDALFHRNDMCHVSLHTMDRFEGEPEQWAVSISGSGNVTFNFIHESEKMCRVKFAEILGQDLITIDIITSLGLKSE